MRCETQPVRYPAPANRVFVYLTAGFIAIAPGCGTVGLNNHHQFLVFVFTLVFGIMVFGYLALQCWSRLPLLLQVFLSDWLSS